ncbi:MAG: NAD(P)-dependent oxidoreductase, partial [Bacteroidota bacterium]|nr:NAD(P)-dependent oxidoreductase [Bacteroidota bacterium]MDX5429717.1 NAD(P)-dependent oxidoreductase [Bacteroidota bacterium]MDX5468498.1 NAD(P)-dependent oxidoreductase [Bacteroidota bacterium]
MVHLALIREEKQPYDRRVALNPAQCRDLLDAYPGLKIYVQPSGHRCFPDSAYAAAGCILSEDLSDAQVLMGIKEVPEQFLIPNKTYLFFSHTIKKQPYNRRMLQGIIKKNIRLVDYECLTWENGGRIIGFGRFAGIVGTHEGIKAYGLKTGAYTLPAAHQVKTYQELLSAYNAISLPSMKIALCGDGRVAHGALELLDKLKIREVTSRAYLYDTFNEPVYVHLRIDHLYENHNNSPFDKSYFYRNPSEYFSTFNQYWPVTDLMINAIYWNEEIPRFFSLVDMQRPDFRIKTIADITCDIDGSVPSTVRASSIEEPVYGWNPFTKTETAPYLKNTIDVMAVSNLPTEL